MLCVTLLSCYFKIKMLHNVGGDLFCKTALQDYRLSSILRSEVENFNADFLLLLLLLLFIVCDAVMILRKTAGESRTER